MTVGGITELNPSSLPAEGGRLFRFYIKGCIFIPLYYYPVYVTGILMLCVFIPSEGSALLSSFDFRATLSRAIFSKKSSRNASHMRTVFLIKESLFDGKVLPRNCHAGQVLRASSSPSPKIEVEFFFFRMGSLGRHYWHLHRFPVFAIIKTT